MSAFEGDAPGEDPAHTTGSRNAAQQTPSSPKNGARLQNNSRFSTTTYPGPRQGPTFSVLLGRGLLPVLMSDHFHCHKLVLLVGTWPDLSELTEQVRYGPCNNQSRILDIGSWGTVPQDSHGLF